MAFSVVTSCCISDEPCQWEGGISTPTPKICGLDTLKLNLRSTSKGHATC